jgi:hypothetical protein
LPFRARGRLACRLAPICTIVAFILLAVPARAATPRDELLRFVPQDAGFCLVIDDLRGHWAQLFDSPFGQQFRKSAMGSAIEADPAWKKLDKQRKQLEKLLGLAWAKLRDEILGDAVVLAYFPGPPDKPDQDQGLILVRARNGKTLKKLVDGVNKVQKVSKEIKKVEARDHNGRRYFQRIGAKSAQYYYLDGPILAISSQEVLLRRALDCDRLLKPDAEPPAAEQLRLLLGKERRLASLLINPRAFDAAIAAKAKSANASEAAVLTNFLTYWKALDGVALAASVTDDLEGTLAVRGRLTDLPPAAQRVLRGMRKPSELWRRFPDNALFAAAGQIDVGAFEEMLGGFMAKESRDALHDALDRNFGATLDKDIVKEVLPYLGPDVGVCITAPEPGSKTWVPRALFAVQARPGDKPPVVDKAILSAIDAFAKVNVIDINNKHKDQKTSLKTVMQDKVEVKYLQSDKRFPPGLQPAYALKDGYLVLASSPDAIQRFAVVKDAPNFGSEVPLARASLKDLRRYLEEYKKPLADALAKNNKLKPDEATKQLDNLLVTLQLFDRVELSQRRADGQVTLTLRVRTAQPLKK